MKGKITVHIRDGATICGSMIRDIETKFEDAHSDEVLVNFGHPMVTYFWKDIKALPMEEWFCLDRNGRNYGTEPMGVYVQVSDVHKALVDFDGTEPLPTRPLTTIIPGVHNRRVKAVKKGSL